MTEHPSGRAGLRRSVAAIGAVRPRAGAVVAIALLAAFVTWLVFVRDAGETPQPPASPAPPSPVAVTEDALRTLAAATSSPIYWIGPRRGFRYELTTTVQGETYVRYLPRGVEVGSTDAYLTIGTYAVDDAFGATRRAAARSGSVSVPLAGGGVAFHNENEPTNVYLARPGSHHQVEVYDPSGDAPRLVSSGKVVEVAKTKALDVRAGASATATSVAEMRELAESRGQAIYWIGPEPGTTYELRETPAGSFVRYLPRGEGGGDPQLTVGTYPMENAFSATRALARGPRAVRIPVGAGGIAFYDRERPTNVYVAYAGRDVQIELFDPAAEKARELVASGRIVPVG